MRRAFAAALLLALGACAPEAPEATRPVAAAPVNRAGCDTNIRIVNASNRMVGRLYFQDAGLTSWGVDRLGQNVIQAGASTTLNTGTPGPLNFRIVYQDNRTAEIRAVNLCATRTLTIGNFAINAS